jgi:hypothetical protein
VMLVSRVILVVEEFRRRKVRNLRGKNGKLYGFGAGKSS